MNRRKTMVGLTAAMVAATVSAVTLENAAIRFDFAEGEDGFALQSAVNKFAGDVAFLNADGKRGELWELVFWKDARSEEGRARREEGRARSEEGRGGGGGRNAVTLNNNSKCRATRLVMNADGGATFVWEGLDLPGAKGAVTVRATVAFKPDGTSAWTLDVQNQSTAYGLAETRYPILRNVVADGKSDILKPRPDTGAMLIRRATMGKTIRPYGGGCMSYLPMMSAFFLDGAGLYVGAHDGEARIKSFFLDKNYTFKFVTPVENAGLAGKAAEGPRYAVTIAAIGSSWWDAARLYRAWALTTKWAAKGPIINRDDYPRRLVEIPIWLNTHALPDEVSNTMARAHQVFPKYETGIHWHVWQHSKHDINYPEYFPEQDGAKECFAFCKTIGAEPMPYTNGRLWSTNLLSYAYVKPYTIKKANGEPVVEQYGPRTPPMSPMCPYTSQWDETLNDFASRILALGSRSLFLDQLGACSGAPCYDPNHGHPVGGGTWYFDGYQRLLAKAHDNYSSHGAFLTTEGSGEEWINVIDGYLCVTQRQPNDVPFWHAVYNGYTTYFCSPENQDDDFTSFQAAQVRELLWGQALGWYHPLILEKNDKCGLLRRLADFRQLHLDCFGYGTLLGEIEFAEKIPDVNLTWLGRKPFWAWKFADWPLSKTITGKMPSILGYRWKSARDGAEWAFVANVGTEKMSVSFLFGGEWRRLTLDSGDLRSVKIEAADLARPVKRVAALPDEAWNCSEWLSVVDAPVFTNKVVTKVRAADGTSVFMNEVTNPKAVVGAKWMTTGLGVYDLFINGRRIGDDFLKPGYTHWQKTKYAFTYDVTEAISLEKGGRNTFSAEVSAGWWRDKIVSPAGHDGFVGKKSAFRGVLELTFADGTTKLYGTRTTTWKAGIAGPVAHAAIFDGEEYDARKSYPSNPSMLKTPEANDEFKGAILPTAGAEIVLRHDRAIVKGPYSLKKGETLLVDFGQNCAAVPFFVFKAKRGTVLTCLPGEMLNDADKGERGCDGPKGSLYRLNLRYPEGGMRIVYTFRGGDDFEAYHPRFSFFGYRYVSITATDDVEIDSLVSVPVSSIRADQELGTLETGDATFNRFVKNVYWGHLSNYLSVPTDCPQRNERLGWTADTQVFCETAAFNADVYDFLSKWMRDMRDSQHEDGSFPSVAPFGQYGNEGHRLGWADAGVIVPYTMWKMFGDVRIIRENFDAMERFLAMQDATQYKTPKSPNPKPGFEYCGQYADWLSFEDYEPCNRSAYKWSDDGKKNLGIRPESILYWNYLAGCYWLWDAQMMAEMAQAIGRSADVEKYRAMAEKAMAYLRADYVDPTDGMLLKPFRHLQGAALFALKFGVLTDAAAIEATKKALRQNFADHNGCLATGFLGTSILMDTLTANGMADIALDLLMNHKFPSWLYSVDQGATTIWERWNSYTKKDGFGPVGMNSFNHYAYGAVLAWVYRSVAGIAADPTRPGFRNIVMAPHPDRRLGHVTATYRSAAGLIKSAWRYEGAKWIWDFTIPEGATATVTLPGENNSAIYKAGTYHLEK